jgi:hypothetical protein
MEFLVSYFSAANLRAVAANSCYEAGFSTFVHVTTCAELTNYIELSTNREATRC